jgi:hypothetical protein
MTKPNEGKQETKIHNCDAPIEQRYFINLRILAQALSIGLGFCLTCYLACREQYLDSLLGLSLTIAAGTCDRLKRIGIGLKGLESEWRDPPK